MSMALTYYKRYRMELDLRGRDFSRVVLPSGYRLIPWELSNVEQHAEAKQRSFAREIDSQVFPCLASYDGCLRLMREIARKGGFCAGATWLLCREVPRIINTGRLELCGTIQGIIDSNRHGSIQNVGIVPQYRGRGLGSLLMAKALHGFRQAGALRAHLEVTSQNEGAIRLYRRMGFTKARTVYKVVEDAYT
jgi:ribosomal protein S18 acetylase RimI-like enzyme